MIDFKIFDQYSVRARLQPALLTLLPGAIAIFAWTGPGIKWESALWTLIGTAGGTYFLAILARNFGKQIEPELWRSWGGAPTTQLLRHSGPANSVMRERWHNYLSGLLGKTFPTPQEEIVDPIRADEIYNAAVKLQIGKTRDTKKYYLLFKENMQYGFCRNLFAMRSTGIIFSMLGIALCCCAGVWYVHTGRSNIAPWVCAGVDALLLFWWIFTINANWVKIPAFAYAERLFESVEMKGRTKLTTDK
jgi:hypothetical protein